MTDQLACPVPTYDLKAYYLEGLMSKNAPPAPGQEWTSCMPSDFELDFDDDSLKASWNPPLTPGNPGPDVAPAALLLRTMAIPGATVW